MNPQNQKKKGCKKEGSRNLVNSFEWKCFGEEDIGGFEERCIDGGGSSSDGGGWSPRRRFEAAEEPDAIGI